MVVVAVSVGDYADPVLPLNGEPVLVSVLVPQPPGCPVLLEPLKHTQHISVHPTCPSCVTIHCQWYVRTLVQKKQTNTSWFLWQSKNYKGG